MPSSEPFDDLHVTEMSILKDRLAHFTFDPHRMSIIKVLPFTCADSLFCKESHRMSIIKVLPRRLRSTLFSSLIACLPFVPCEKTSAQSIPSRGDTISEFCKRLEPLGRILETPDYFVWCCAPIFDNLGNIHVFYSRWPARLGMGGWLKGSEIAHAIAKKPEGPYQYVETILAPRPGFWDATTCHNPHIQLVDGLYCLFYMGNSNGKTNTKRIGLATAKSIDGPWTRFDRPLLEVGEKGSWDDHCTTNPAFIKDSEGKYRLYYKSWNDSAYAHSSGSIRGNRKYGLALADNLFGPYRRIEDNPVVDFSALDGNKQVEDAYIWLEDGIYRMLMRDMGFFNHTVGLYMESNDGIHWSPPKIGWLGLSEYVREVPAPASLKRYGRLERPQLLMKNGRPAFLFNAAQGGAYGTSSGFVFKINEINETTDANTH
jgi:hypothetical protein